MLIGLQILGSTLQKAPVRRHRASHRMVAEFGSLLRSKRCTFAPYVRHISAFRTFMEPDHHHFDKIGKDLKRLTTLTGLMLDDMFHACAPWADFMCGFPEVTDVSIHFHLSGNSNCVLGMIHMLPSLRKLRITPISPVVFWTAKPPAPSIDIPPQYLTPPAHLHDITTGGTSARHILAWLKWYSRLPQINILELSPIPPEDVPQVTESLRLMGSTLRHLKLDWESLFMGNTVYQCASFIDILDLSFFKKIKSITIPQLNDDTQDAAAYEGLLKFILRISSPELESVRIHYPGAGYQLMDWAVVDRFFASPDFPRLRIVQVPPLLEYPEKLPRLHQLGLLNTKSSY
ncbi:hypothetical protein B0H16DRAFT_1716296 [Mycena metata]|uniref:Uncharacterized protein n=1 Tax=Mycena metata TaxID=1033252 RepID=A0AAD7JMW4_9AGAR|nr:hypothetical protein B0H16DRAFT_1716296 [Mycena metata]